MQNVIIAAILGFLVGSIFGYLIINYTSNKKFDKEQQRYQTLLEKKETEINFYNSKACGDP